MNRETKETLRRYGITEKELLDISRTAHISPSRYVTGLVVYKHILGVVFYATRLGVGLYNTMIYDIKAKKVLLGDHEYTRSDALSHMATSSVEYANCQAVVEESKNEHISSLL